MSLGQPGYSLGLSVAVAVLHVTKDLDHGLLYRPRESSPGQSLPCHWVSRGTHCGCRIILLANVRNFKLSLMNYLVPNFYSTLAVFGIFEITKTCTNITFPSKYYISKVLCLVSGLSLAILKDHRRIYKAME
jgi:hypothetical protein